MALRDQPYFPMYVQDYLTDEKLAQCSWKNQGIYVKILCLFHKQDPYGGFLLKQKDKQNESMCLNVASKLVNLLPIGLQDMKEALEELVEEGVLKIDGDFIYNKRMVEDNELSIKRAEAGRKGGTKTQSKKEDIVQDFALAKDKANIQANSEYENENENKDNKRGKSAEKGEKKFNFRSSLLNLGVSKEVVDAFLQVRKNKKATNSELAFKRIVSDIDSSGFTYHEAIKYAAEHDWKKFELQWYLNKEGIDPKDWKKGKKKGQSISIKQDTIEH